MPVETKEFLQVFLSAAAVLTAVLLVSPHLNINLQGTVLTVAAIGAIQILNAAYRAFSPDGSTVRKFLIGTIISLLMIGLALMVAPFPTGSFVIWIVFSLLAAAFSLTLPMHPPEKPAQEREKEPVIEGNTLTFSSRKTYDLDQLNRVELGPSREGSSEVTLTFEDGATLTVGPSHNAHALAATLRSRATTGQPPDQPKAS